MVQGRHAGVVGLVELGILEHKWQVAGGSVGKQWISRVSSLVYWWYRCFIRRIEQHLEA